MEQKQTSAHAEDVLSAVVPATEWEDLKHKAVPQWNLDMLRQIDLARPFDPFAPFVEVKSEQVDAVLDGKPARDWLATLAALYDFGEFLGPSKKTGVFYGRLEKLQTERDPSGIARDVIRGCLMQWYNYRAFMTSGTHVRSIRVQLLGADLRQYTDDLTFTQLFENKLWDLQLQTAPSAVYLNIMRGAWPTLRDINFAVNRDSIASGRGADARTQTKWRGSHEDGLKLCANLLEKDQEWAADYVLRRVSAPYFIHREHRENHILSWGALKGRFRFDPGHVRQYFDQHFLSIGNRDRDVSPTGSRLAAADVKTRAAKLGFWIFACERFRLALADLDRYHLPFAGLSDAFAGLGALRTQSRGVLVRIAEQIRGLLAHGAAVDGAGLRDARLSSYDNHAVLLDADVLFSRLAPRDKEVALTVEFVAEHRVYRRMADNLDADLVKLEKLGMDMCTAVANATGGSDEIRPPSATCNMLICTVPLPLETADALQLEMTKRIEFSLLLLDKELLTEANHPTADQVDLMTPWNSLLNLRGQVVSLARRRTERAIMTLASLFEACAYTHAAVFACHVFRERAKLYP